MIRFISKESKMSEKERYSSYSGSSFVMPSLLNEINESR